MKVLLTLMIGYVLSLKNQNKISELYIKCVGELQRIRIVGGRECKINEFPFMVSIQYPRNLLIHRCGGTLINSFYVLTTAHCFSHVLNLDEYTVVAGIPDMDDINAVLGNSDAWEEAKGHGDFYGQKSGLLSILIDYAYDSLTHVNDIALIYLTNPMVPSAAVGFVNLPNYKYVTDPYKIFKNCTVVGWGVQLPMISMQNPYLNCTHIKDNNLTNMLQCASLPLITNKKCNYFIRQFTNFEIRTSQMCTLYFQGGIDACYGDSGGPLICNKIQLGITSIGWGCALPYRPAVFTRVDFFLDWIKENSVTPRSKMQTVSKNSVAMLNMHYSFPLYIIISHKKISY